ncbi:hypothetical protein KLP28_09625 [Nocardioidaceae bacterium]|nr:hypothetical protein KLP28_09625 [Nocardioidaceae bacterium]
MELVIVVLLGAFAFVGGIALMVAIVLGLLNPSRLKSKVDDLRPSKR